MKKKKCDSCIWIINGREKREKEKNQTLFGCAKKSSWLLLQNSSQSWNLSTIWSNNNNNNKYIYNEETNMVLVDKVELY